MTNVSVTQDLRNSGLDSHALKGQSSQQHSLSTNDGNAISKATTSLKEPINEVAQKATSDKKLALDSLEKIADGIDEAILVLNQALERSPTKAMVRRDEQLNRFIIKIADEASGEVVREIPSEAVLKFARNLEEMKGLLFDESL
ncbi:flagellar protein FlaG [Luminiphilus sp.]|nr:flagellar protein FlaG [Luminiphilus sp.]